MEHLKSVYSCFGICIVATTIGTLISMSFDIFQNGTVALAGSFIFFLLLEFTHNRTKFQSMGLLIGFSGSMGLLMGSYVNSLTRDNPNIIKPALMISTTIFVTLTFCALISNDYWLFLRRPLFSSLSFLVYLNVGDLLFRGAFLMEQINLYLGLPVMCGYVLYDTQFIHQEVEYPDHIQLVLPLLIDFIGIFGRVLKIMSQKG